MKIPNAYPTPWDNGPDYTENLPGMDPCHLCGDDFYPTDLLTYGDRVLCVSCAPKCGERFVKDGHSYVCVEPMQPGDEGGRCWGHAVETLRELIKDATAERDYDAITEYTAELAVLLGEAVTA
jgi:predicted trehalose synthase